MDYEKPVTSENVKAKVAHRDANEYAGRFISGNSRICTLAQSMNEDFAFLLLTKVVRLSKARTVCREIYLLYIRGHHHRWALRMKTPP